ncbi:MAG TPA: phosphate ABC transporter substrate-binding protein PstS [Thermoplasmata archaeon]|nr:phosphate ABC transporter substrate-binding protein PstS [Thermoplasmata archaeon]
MNAPVDAVGASPVDPIGTLGPTPPIRRRAARPGRTWTWAVAAVAVALLAGAGTSFGWFGQPGSGYSGNCPTGQRLLGDGAGFLLPIMSVWASSYSANTSNSINYNPAGAGAGIAALSNRLVDFAATDEPLSMADYGTLPGVVLTLPVTGGALAIPYDLPGVSAPIRLDGSVLAGIYLGTIAQWNDPALEALNPGVVLPAHAIQTVHRADAAGTTYVLSDYLSKESSAWSHGPGRGIQLSWPSAPLQQAALGNSKVVEYVAKTPYAIGYADLADVLAVSGLQYASLQNPSGSFIRPDLASTASAIDDFANTTQFPSASAPWTNVSLVDAAGPTDYPMVTFAYFLVFQDARAGFAPSSAKTQALVQWLDWVIQAGQAVAPTLDYVGLPAPVLALDRSAIGTISFEGDRVSCSALG